MPHGIIEIGKEGYLSCSQLGNLYGCGYGTMLDVYDRYKGIPHAEDFSEEAKKSMEFGTFFEESVAQFFMLKTGLKVKKMGNGKTAYWRKDMPYFICHPDRIGVGRDSKGRRFALEIKCVRPSAEGWGDEWTADVPDKFFLQDQGYFACEVPCDVVYMAVLRGNRVYFYEVEPDGDVIADILKRVRETKDSFDVGIVPDSENYEEALRVLVSKVDYEKEGMPAGDEGRALWDEMVANHKVLNDATEKEEKLKTKMVALMGDCPAVVTGDDKGKIKILAKLVKTTKKTFDKDGLKDKMSQIFEQFAGEQVSYSVRYSWPRDKKEKED